jgi:hypothetical protein
MVLTSHGETTGRIEDAVQIAAEWPLRVAVDMASYDTTVAYETHVAIRDELWLPIAHYMYGMAGMARRILPHPELLAEVDELIITNDILAASRDPRFGAELWSAKGQIRSGENPTSWKGSEIKRGQGQLKLTRIAGAEPGINARVLNYGDDTLLVTSDEDIIKRWFSNTSYLGMNETVAADATFLMKRLPEGHAYLGRMVQQCINREITHEPANMALAAAAFAARRLLLHGHPAQASFFNHLRAYGGPERFTAAVTLADATAEKGLEAVLQLCTAAGSTAAEIGDEEADISATVAALHAMPGINDADRASITAVAARLGLASRGARHYLSWQSLHEASTDLTPNVTHQHLLKYR